MPWWVLDTFSYKFLLLSWTQIWFYQNRITLWTQILIHQYKNKPYKTNDIHVPLSDWKQPNIIQKIQINISNEKCSNKTSRPTYVLSRNSLSRNYFQWRSVRYECHPSVRMVWEFLLYSAFVTGFETRLIFNLNETKRSHIF